MRRVVDAHQVEPDGIYPNVGIYSYGRGLFPKPPIEGISTSAKTLYRISTSQFIYSRLFAFEGAYGMVPDGFDGCFVSNEYPTFECDSEHICAAFLWAYFRSPRVWAAVAAKSQGLGDRRQRVQPEKLLKHRLRLPPVEWQERIIRLHSHLETMKQYQSESTTELDTLLPTVLDRAFKGEA
jgi:type I restriction enzyme S subunit